MALYKSHLESTIDSSGPSNLDNTSEGLMMVPRSGNARGLRTPYVLADPPCVHPKGLTCANEATQPQGLIGPLTKT